MTVVRRHPPRRFHAPNYGRTFPNSPSAKNARRLQNGLRKIQTHSNARVADLNWCKKPKIDDNLDITKEARSIYGWFCTAISNMNCRQHQQGIHGSSELTNLEHAKRELGLILMEIMELDANLTIVEKFHILHQNIVPTFKHVYLPSGEKIDGNMYVYEKLEKMSQQDNRFLLVLGHLV
jgi:hypothetical protein